MGRRLVRRGAVVLAAAALLLTPAAASAQGGTGDVRTVRATVAQIVDAERTVPDALGDDGADGDPDTVQSMVQVDDRLYALPSGTVLPGASGEQVELTVRAPGADTDAEAMDAVANGSGQVLAADVDGSTRADVTGGADSTPSVFGTHTLVVLPVTWPDAAALPSQDTLAAVAASTGAYWSSQSGGRITLSTSVRAPVTIAAPGPCTDSTAASIFNAALAANGLSQPTGYTHYLVFTPRYTSCYVWAGLAAVGGHQIWANGYALLDVFAHEFGHNLGLLHAHTMTCTSGPTRVTLTVPWAGCSSAEYGDTADVMASASTTLPTGSLNTAEADYLGLVRSVTMTGTAMSVQLAPLGAVDGLRAVRIPVTGGTVYVDFRPAVGNDVRMPSWAGVQLHLQVLNSAGQPTSYLLDAQPGTATAFADADLPLGGTWVVPGTTVTVTVAATGSVATLQVGDVKTYVQRVYRDLFHRSVDADGYRDWVTGLLSGRRQRSDVANAITSSDEYRLALIGAAYQEYLGRAPDAAGQRFWLTRMQSGMTIDQLESGFVSSQEAYQLAGSTGSAWLAATYRQVLGRDADAAGAAFWVHLLEAGMSRTDVARGFLLSTEHLITVVNGQYRELLGRSLDPTGQQTWVRDLQAGTRLENVIGGIIGSQEYYLKS